MPLTKYATSLDRRRARTAENGRKSLRLCDSTAVLLPGDGALIPLAEPAGVRRAMAAAAETGRG
eukprot:scaffold17397_cov125-Isochrysis_galbana.AAC.1